MANSMRSDNIICISRKFQDAPDKGSREATKGFFDLDAGGDIDKTAQQKLQNMANRLNGRVDPNNEINLQIPWTKSGVDLSIAAHAQYVDTLCQEYEFLLGNMVARVQGEKTAYQTRQVYQIGKGKTEISVRRNAQNKLLKKTGWFWIANLNSKLQLMLQHIIQEA